MNRKTTIGAFSSAIVLLCFCLTGCGTIPSYEPIGGGYVEATYMRTSWSEPTAMRIALEQKEGWRTVMIWPSLDFTREVVNGDVAIFVADIASAETNSEDPRATEPRLFAVKTPDLPLDINCEILRQWANETGHNYSMFSPRTIVTPHQKGDEVEFTFSIDWNKGATNTLNWNQISDIMREVKEKGVVKKDRVWGTKYIEIEYKPEIQKSVSP